MRDEKVRISYFSDVLCIWAYVSQIRVDELKLNFGDRVEVHCHFLPLFGSTDSRIGEGWRAKGGFEGYAKHVQKIGKQFPHIEIHPEVWRRNPPHSSGTAHLFLKAVQLQEEAVLVRGLSVERFEGRTPFEELVWQTRRSFFVENLDVSSLSCLLDLARRVGLPVGAIEKQMTNGRAMAAMIRDLELGNRLRVEGSPTYVMNEGRQKLYGNVGYKILEANVQEILEHPNYQASWC